MRPCENCGNPLHDDSTFCFNCMCEQNTRENIPFDVRIPKPKTAKIACAAAAMTAASAVFVATNYANASSDNTPNVQVVTVTPTVITTVAPKSDTPTQTTTLPPAPNADDIDKIAAGLANAATGSAAATTQTTTTAATETAATAPQVYADNNDQPVENYDNTDDDQDQVTSEEWYYSADGANDLSNYLVDKVNQKRSSKGYSTLRACGQLDDLLSQSLDTLCTDESVGGNIYWDEISLDKLKSNLGNVGLPSNTELVRVILLDLDFESYDKAYDYAKNVDLSNLHFSDEEGFLTLYNQRLDYKYIGTNIYKTTTRQSNIQYSKYACEIWLMK
ncbi:hypothetical protein [Ruminococcus sp.]|uniref:hypothetical protein n=1 Tax=Ruminococcus sp. TaxID=41978 RepID=UPI0025D2B3FC|nr:hypothetical protein [Ruminococcus sp.]